MSSETGRNCKACERWEVTQWGLMVSACSAELNSRTGNRRFLLHPHAHTSCTRRVPTVSWCLVPHGVFPCWSLHPHCCLLRATCQLLSHAIPSPSVFLIPGHETNSGPPPFCSTQANILDKTDPGCPTHIICLYYPIIPLRTMQVLCNFFYTLTVRLDKEPTSTHHFLGPHLDHHTINVLFSRKTLSYFPLESVRCFCKANPD